MKSIKYLVSELYKYKWNDKNVTFHEVLRRMYIDHDMSMEDIAKELHLSNGSVFNYLKQEGIQKELTWK